MLLGDRCQSRPNICWMSQRRTQHSHTLLFRRQCDVSSPNNRLWVRPLSCRCQSFRPRWDLSRPVPQLCSGELTHQMSSRNAITHSNGLNLAWMASNAPCCPKENNAGMRASPCSPPAPCRISWTPPSSSSHKYVEGEPQKLTHEWEQCVTPRYGAR